MDIVPSSEQQSIIQNVIDGNNVLVDAVAGSGKTTTIIAIANELQKLGSEFHIFQITFNSLLKIEVRNKIAACNLKNINVFTYHSLATTFYDKSAYNDSKLNLIIDNDTTIKKNPKCDILIIDEAQDMTRLYYKLICKFMKDCAPNAQLVVLGDRHQSVYAFMQADQRFLTMADKVWNRQFIKLTLKESYRLTKQVAWFVNKWMVNEDRIIAKKPGVKVDFYISNPFKHIFMQDIIMRIRSGQLKPDDIFILSTSLKSTLAPAKQIENLLVSANIPVYVPLSDDAKLDEDVMRGKVVFTTFPSSKGRERKVVIVLGLDASYFKYFAKEEPQHKCPSALYVAVTRAKERLIVVSSSNEEHPQFLKPNHNDSLLFMNIYGGKKISRINNKLSQGQCVQSIRKSSPTDIIKYLKQEAIASLSPIVSKLFTHIVNSDGVVQIPSKIQSCIKSDHYEDVSDLNGMAIPIMWEAKNTKDGLTTLHKRIDGNLNFSSVKNNKILIKALANIQSPCKTIEDFLYLCNVYLAEQEGYHGRIAQIKKYNWLDETMISNCHTHLEKYVDKKDIEFEYNISLKDGINTPFGKLLMNGYIDAINYNTIWELKCVDNLQLEHFLQLIVYAWMYHSFHGDTKTYKIMNLRSGDIFELNYIPEKINTIMDILIAHKFASDLKQTDAEFFNSLDSSIP